MTDPRFSVNRNLGKFIDLDTGNRLGAPRDDSPLVIVAGPWENMPKGAMQAKCKICKRLVGVDQRSQNFLAQPGRVHMLMCRDCWEGFQLHRAGDLEALSEWLDRMEKRRRAALDIR